jgi:aldehyde dehydrogenase (NAD+)
MEQEINRIFKLQMEHKWSLKTTSAGERIVKLRNLQKVILKYRSEIVRAVYADFKKPEEEVLITEILPAISEIKHAIKHLSRWMAAKRVRAPITHFGAKCSIRYEPKGVSLVLSPWNFPFQLAVNPIVSAIAAGNTVVLKPSEYSAETSKLLRKLLGEIFEEHEMAVIEGDYKVAEALLELPFDNIFFTGSPAVGRLVMTAAAKHLTPVTLELGGKSPVVITASADIDAAAKKIAWGKCLNAGQICVAPDYALVPEDKVQVFTDKLKYYIYSYYGKLNEGKDSAKYTRIISQRHFVRLRDLIQDALEKGANLICGGHYDEADNFITPTVLTNVSDDAAILEEEIFGPVLPIIAYNDLEEAVKIINSKPKPLALYIFTKDEASGSYILNNTESGDALINDVILHVANVNLPFGGVNNSGLGKSHGHHGFMAFTHERSLMKQGRVSAASALYPPFNDRKRRFIELLMRYL